jgi:hypothetical protein
MSVLAVACSNTDGVMTFAIAFMVVGVAWAIVWGLK